MSNNNSNAKKNLAITEEEYYLNALNNMQIQELEDDGALIKLEPGLKVHQSRHVEVDEEGKRSSSEEGRRLINTIEKSLESVSHYMKLSDSNNTSMQVI